MTQSTTRIALMAFALLVASDAHADEVFLPQAAQSRAAILHEALTAGASPAALLAAPTGTTASSSPIAALPNTSPKESELNSSNTSQITQIGTNNFATASQLGANNLSMLSQQGRGNTAIVNQINHAR